MDRKAYYIKRNINLKWFNVDGHLAKSKIIESGVSYEGKSNTTKIHNGGHNFFYCPDPLTLIERKQNRF